ncbi:MAG: tetratricopeptide repeat protein [Candidatus Korobacteraceae bacterium]
MSATRESRSAVSDRTSFDKSLERGGVAQLWLALLALAVHGLSLTYNLVYEDRRTVLQNSVIDSWSRVPQYFTTDLSSLHGSNFYRPFTALYQRLMYAMIGTSAWGWHAGSVLLNLLCVLLVFALARQLLRDTATAFFAAALYAVHPTHVEAVSWISAAGDPLMTAFVLASAVAYLHWRKGESAAWLAAALASGAAALLTKDMAVVLPAMLSAFLLLPGAARRWRSQLAALAAFWAEAFAFLAVRSHILHGFSHPLSGATTADMILTWPAAIAFYLRDMVFPVEMTPSYAFAFVHSASSPGFLWPLLALIVLAAGLSWLLRKATDRRLYLVCLAWTVVPLAPVMYLKVFVPFEIVHDRYLYMPTIGLCMAVAAAITSLASRTESADGVRLRGLIAVLLVGASAAATVGYESWWQSDLTLYRRILSITPDNLAAQLDLSVVLMEHRQYDAAIRILDPVLQQEPDNAEALFDRGRAAWETGDNATAERCFEQSAQLAPDVKRWLFLASVKLRIGKAKEGELAARQALAMEPTEPYAHLALGQALLDEGNKAGAIAEFEEELRLHPDTPGAQQALERARTQNRSCAPPEEQQQGQLPHFCQKKAEMGHRGNLVVS